MSNNTPIEWIRVSDDDHQITTEELLELKNKLSEIPAIQRMNELSEIEKTRPLTDMEDDELNEILKDVMRGDGSVIDDTEFQNCPPE